MGLIETTGDMDVLIERSLLIAEKVLRTIAEFGLGSIDITIDDLMDEDGVVQLGIVPYRIDILNTIPAVDFKDAYATCKTIIENDVEIKCIHINQLIANKRAVGRHKDLADVKTLEKILKRKK